MSKKIRSLIVGIMLFVVIATQSACTLNIGGIEIDTAAGTVMYRNENVQQASDENVLP